MSRFKTTKAAAAVRNKIRQYVQYYETAKGEKPDSVALYPDQLRALGAKPGDRYKGLELREHKPGGGVQKKLYADR